jgi:hypothetical protein
MWCAEVLAIFRNRCYARFGGASLAVRSAAVAAALPDLAAAMQLFVVAASDLFARAGSTGEMGRVVSPKARCGDGESDGSILDDEIHPIGKTVAIVARLGKVTRAQINAAREGSRCGPAPLAIFRRSMPR